MAIMIPTKRNKLWRLPINTLGKDFVVGDLHGCYDDLFAVLAHLNFNFDTDRLFSVGDMVDRGPLSKKCAELIFEPWFYATRANHEQMMIEALCGRNHFTPLVNYHEGNLWVPNGGTWSFGEDPGDLGSLAISLDQLPFMIVVGEGDTRFHVVHAEVSHVDNQGVRVPVTNQMIDDWVFTAEDEYEMLWGRELIQREQPSKWHADDLAVTFVGHTPVTGTVMVQRQIYIDGGAVFGHRAGSSHANKLYIAEPAAKVIHSMITFKDIGETVERFASVSFSDITTLK